MPRGPHGQNRPADVITNAVTVMRIATGEDRETTKKKKRGPPKKSIKPRKR